MRTLSMLACCGVLLTIAGCGGGGGGTASVPAAAADPAATANAIAAPADNVQPVSVEPGPVGVVNRAVNLPFISVTVCAPGSSTICQTIDHVVVDTASSGLRIVASVMSPALLQALGQQTDTGSNWLGTCAQFASGSSWGPVKIADVRIAAKEAASVPMQVIGDATFPAIPSACSSTGPSLNSVQTLLANGILGVGVFREDCGSFCVGSASAGFYYACPASGCVATAVPLDRQVRNPVTMFASDNNGVILQLPAIASSGAVTVAGALVFGIGTRANNGLGNATVFGVSPTTGRFTTVYRGSSLTESFLDSGSNGYFFNDAGIPRCSTNSGFYCPAAPLNLSATIQGTNGAVAAVDFTVANTNTLLQNNPAASAFNNLAGPIGPFSAFDWGLPFFFGRSVYTAFVEADTPKGMGPYIAF